MQGLTKFNDEEHRLKAEEKAKDSGNRRVRYRSAIKKVAAAQRQLDDLDLIGRSPLVYSYLLLCNGAFLIVKTNTFNNFILFCIIVAGLLVGVGQYYNEEPTDFECGVPDEDSINLPPAFLGTIDTVIFWIFVIELVLKLMAEGIGWYYFLIGPEWKWNLFDTAVVLASALSTGGNVKLLRLIRLMRLAKVFRKIPQLQMIIMGLVGGLKSIFYIVILMSLTYYIYAIIAILYLSNNDPWHFKTVEIAMITLFRVATLDGWGDAMFISYHGCHEYGWDVYTDDADEANEIKIVDWDGGLTYQQGGVILCDEERELPGKFLTAAFYISFIMLASFCMLSLFVGAVSMSMAESMEKMMEEKAAKRYLRNKALIEKKIEEMSNTANMVKETRRQRNLLIQAFQGQHMHHYRENAVLDWSNPRSVYKKLANIVEDIVESKTFNNFITICIIIAGVLVGLATKEDLAKHTTVRIVLNSLDDFILIVFVMEMVLKIIAEDDHPFNYFTNFWNQFDAFIVFASLVTFFELIPLDGNFVVVFRLLKLMRVLKLMRALPQLQVIVEALGKGMSSIGFVGLILGIFFYFFGILAMILFKENDPWHFETLGMTVISLFQCATLDDWAPIMYVNMYGCAVDSVFGMDAEDCENPQPQPLTAAIYFVFFILVGGLVLLTLFIGVVSMGMDEAEAEQKELKKINDRVFKIQEVESLTDEEVELYRDVFHIIDFTKSNNIGRDELQFGFVVSDVDMTEDEFTLLFSRVDKDKSAAIDFAEFLEFMFDLKDQLNKWPEERKNNLGKRRKKKEGFNFLSDRVKTKEAAVAPVASNADLMGTEPEEEAFVMKSSSSPTKPTTPTKQAWSPVPVKDTQSQSQFAPIIVKDDLAATRYVNENNLKLESAEGDIELGVLEKTGSPLATVVNTQQKKIAEQDQLLQQLQNQIQNLQSQLNTLTSSPMKSENLVPSQVVQQQQQQQQPQMLPPQNVNMQTMQMYQSQNQMDQSQSSMLQPMMPMPMMGNPYGMQYAYYPNQPMMHNQSVPMVGMPGTGNTGMNGNSTQPYTPMQSMQGIPMMDQGTFGRMAGESLDGRSSPEGRSPGNGKSPSRFQSKDLRVQSMSNYGNQSSPVRKPTRSLVCSV